MLDFGIAKVAEEQVMKTQAGTLLGTPAYMAPEQCRGAAGVTDKSDVYALGVMMFEMLSGRQPFEGAGIGEIMAAHMFNEPPPLREWAPSVEPALAAFVHRLLAKDPAVRPTMRELIENLERLGAARTGVISAVDDGFGLSGRHKVSPPEARTMAGVEGPGPKQPTHNTGVLPNRTGGTLAMPDGNAGTSGTTNGPGTLPGSGSPGKTYAIIGLSAIVVIGAGVVGMLVLRGGPGKKPRPRPQVVDMGHEGDDLVVPDKPKPKRPPKPKRGPSTPVPEGMVFVPGARFDMGSTAAEIEAAFKLCQARGTKCRRDLYQREQPQRSVAVRDFFLDQAEVTNGQLATWLSAQKGLKLAKKQFVQAGKALLVDILPGTSGIEYDAKWKKLKKAGAYTPHDGFAERPAVLVTWALADRFCTGQGKRLPTEAEWELAARGVERRTFPWGEDVPKCDQLVFGRGPDLSEGRGCPQMSRTPDPVKDSTFDKTDDGVLGLGGNVAEWVRDRYVTPSPACDGKCQDPVVESEGDVPKELRVVRGGNFNLPLDASRGAGRSRLASDQALPDLGFRCAKTVTQP